MGPSGGNAWDESSVARFFRAARAAEAALAEQREAQAREVERVEAARRNEDGGEGAKEEEGDGGEEEGESDEPWKDRGGWYHDHDAEQRHDAGDNTAADGRGSGCR